MKKENTKKAGNVPTLGEVYEEIAALRGKCQADERDLCRGGAVESAKFWSGILRTSKAALQELLDSPEIGKNIDDRMTLLNERAREAQKALDRLMPEIELLPELQRLDTLRLKLEEEQARLNEMGEINIGPVWIGTPDATQFGPAKIGESFSQSILELFLKVSKPVEAEADKVQAAFDALAEATAAITDIQEPIGLDALAAVRKARLNLVNVLKGYLLTASGAYSGLTKLDVVGLVRMRNEVLEAEADKLAVKAEIKLLEAGASPESAAADALQQPAVLEALKGLIDIRTIKVAEDSLARMLLKTAGQARELIETQLTQLS